MVAAEDFGRAGHRRRGVASALVFPVLAAAADPTPLLGVGQENRHPPATFAMPGADDEAATAPSPAVRGRSMARPQLLTTPPPAAPGPSQLPLHDRCRTCASLPRSITKTRL